MRDRVFIDTNIFLYAILDNEKEINKSNKARIFIEKLSDEVEIVISTQVINELYVNLLKNKIQENDIISSINMIIEDSDEVVSIDLGIIKEAWIIKDRYKFSYWDSLIVSSALFGKCKLLYSEDMQNNQSINNNLIIINPLL